MSPVKNAEGEIVSVELSRNQVLGLFNDPIIADAWAQCGLSADIDTLDRLLKLNSFSSEEYQKLVEIAKGETPLTPIQEELIKSF